MTASAARRVRQTSQYPQNTSARKQKNSGEESNIEERFQYSDAGRARSGRLFTPQPSRCARSFDVASQGVTVEGARSNLAEALTLFFETLTLRRLIGGFSLT